MQKVNTEIESVCGMTSDGLEDFAYADAYEDGVSATETARDALSNAGYDLQTRGDNQWTES